MKRRTLSIFEHQKGFAISTENIILIILTFTVFLLVYLQSTSYFDFENWTIYVSIIWILYLTGLMIINFFRYERIYGNLKGKLIFENDSILIKEKKYKIKEISKISFNCFDIKGQFEIATNLFEPHLSNGLKNNVTLNLVNGEEINCSFLQTKNERIKYFKDILTNYYLKGKISWLHLLSILEIEDYNEIQKMKKELNE